MASNTRGFLSAKLGSLNARRITAELQRREGREKKSPPTPQSPASQNLFLPSFLPSLPFPSVYTACRCVVTSAVNEKNIYNSTRRGAFKENRGSELP